MPRASKPKHEEALPVDAASLDPAPVKEPDPPGGGVRFTRPYGFQDEYGDAWFWHPGALVRNPYVLSLLAGRGAPTESVE